MCAQCEGEEEPGLRTATLASEAARWYGAAMRASMLTSVTPAEQRTAWRDAGRMLAFARVKGPETVVTVETTRLEDWVS